MEVMAPSSETVSSTAASLLSVGTLVGLVLGYFIGQVHAVWSRARRDLKTTKSTVPKLRSTMWSAMGSLAIWAVVLTAVLLLVFAGIQ